MSVYYNEIDEGAAEWLRNNIRAGLIADGVVDTRSIQEVQPDDLKGFAQHHFFAGIGGWSYAARLAGWPDDLPLWTASCPCQPFSAAGKGLGTDDPRHLWPDLLRIWRAFRPPVGVGEQVAGKAGYDWFDGVRADLEGEAYLARAVDIPALAVDAPHQRNRLYWLAVADAEGDSSGARLREDGSLGDGPVIADRDGGSSMADGGGDRGWADQPERRSQGRAPAGRHDAGSIALVDAARIGWREGQPESDLQRGRPAATGPDGHVLTLGHSLGEGLEGHGGHGPDGERWPRSARPAPASDVRGGPGQLGDAASGSSEGAGEPEASGWSTWRGEHRGSDGGGRNGTFWSDADWITCHDGKARRVADASAPLLVDGVRGRIPVHRPAGICATAFPEDVRWVSRIGLWKGLGNGIVAQLAAEHLSAVLDIYGEWLAEITGWRAAA